MKCSVCGSEYENSELPVCSSSCSHAVELHADLAKVITETRPTEDPRIFFYPLSFGRLVDEFIVLSFKRSFTKSLKRQQETDYHLFKLRKSIATNLAQIFYDEKSRNGIMSVVTGLFETNGKLWRLNDLARDKRVTTEDRKEAAFSMIELKKTRAKYIQSLDLLLSGKTNHFKVFNGEEF